MKKMRSSASHFTERTKRNEKEKAAGKWLVKIKNKFSREQLDFLRKLWHSTELSLKYEIECSTLKDLNWGI